jgi:hypothetical protein
MIAKISPMFVFTRVPRFAVANGVPAREVSAPTHAFGAGCVRRVELQSPRPTASARS